ncbi:MAG TPA: hypothetical protein VH044_15200 [Polyangiaceae bacterium]|jgi:hypothetical protein|nr:hypothetical protein [Polyangiaceae bacterium]
MPELQVRRDVVGSRREGRRSLSAYNAQARGLLDLSSALIGRQIGRSALQPRRGRWDEDGDFNAGVALAIVYPLMRRGKSADAESFLPHTRSNEGSSMKRKPSIRSLENVSRDEAIAYLDYSNGDEINAAYTLAVDRARLDGSHAAPDDAEVHHALFLLCRARGKHSPSFDETRVELRRRIAA